MMTGFKKVMFPGVHQRICDAYPDLADDDAMRITELALDEWITFNNQGEFLSWDDAEHRIMNLVAVQVALIPTVVGRDRSGLDAA